jgi:hypothetical protein
LAQAAASPDEQAIPILPLDCLLEAPRAEGRLTPLRQARMGCLFTVYQPMVWQPHFKVGALALQVMAYQQDQSTELVYLPIQPPEHIMHILVMVETINPQSSAFAVGSSGFSRPSPGDSKQQTSPRIVNGP